VITGVVFGLLNKQGCPMNEYASGFLRKLCYVVAALVILFALLVSSARLIAPLLDSHRTDLEKWATQMLGAQVSIAEARVTWYQYEPGISLNKVTVFDKEHKDPILQIRKVRIFLSIPQSIWQRKIVPSGVMLSGTTVKLVQTEKGDISLQGFPSLGELSDQPYQHQANVTDVMAWLSAGPRIFLRDVDVHFESPSQKRFITLYNFKFVNSGSEHKTYGSAVLHQEIPTEITVAGNWQGDAKNPASLKVNAYLYLSGLSLPQWFAGSNWHDWQIKEGLGSAKIWIEWNQQQLQKVQSEFQVYNVLLGSLKAAQTRKINRLSGNVGWKQEGGNQIIAGDDILVDLPAHLWPATDFRVVVAKDQAAQWAPKEVSIDYLDINDVESFLLDTFLLPNNIQTLLTQLKLSGTLQNTKVNFGMPWTDFASIKFNSQLDQLSVAPYKLFPGVKNISAKVDWNGVDGDVALQSLQMQFIYPSIFAKPLIFDQANGDIAIHHDASNKSWLAVIKSLRLDNPDLTLTTSGDLTLPSTWQPVSNLNGDFIVKNAKNITRYLPSGIFDKELNEWLDAAFLSGKVDSGKIILKGPLIDFPFDKGTGEFLIKGEVSGVDLHYAPDWPTLKDISAKLVFMNRKVLIDADHAEMLGVPIKKVHGEIPNMGGDDQEWLNITADPIQTDFSNGLEVIKQSPLNKTIGKMFKTMTVTGPTTLNLTLAIPLKNPDNTQVKGDVTLNDSTLNLTPWHLALQKMQGQLQFTEKGMTSDGIQGEFFGKPLTLKMANITQGKNSFVRAAIAGAISAEDLESWLSVSLKNKVSGSTNFKGDIDLSFNAPINVTLSSDLQGMSVALPAPYAKSAKDKQSFKMNLVADENKPLTIKSTYGKDLQLGLVLGKPNWDITVACPMLSGRFSVPANLSKQGLVTAQIDRISVPDSSGGKKIDWDIDPKTLPPIALTVNDLRYGNLAFGRINVKTSPSPQGLMIRSLSMNSNYLQLNGSGEWTNINNRNKTVFKGQAKSRNVSQLLVSWGFDMHNIEMNNGQFDMNLNWPSVPFAPSLDSMNGNARLELGQGRIVEISQSSNAKMDLGRMLNIFSLQTIPRRLSFDFSDVFQKGYSFDSLKGDLNFNDGDIYTTNTAFDGPVARVGITGRIGLAEKDYDLTLSVTPYVTSSIPVAATLLTGQPVIGIAALVVNKMITPAVSNVTTYYYSVRGPWSNPSWENISVSKKKAS
jgi:uncharacterized protein (TIGR02099 family)